MTKFTKFLAATAAVAGLAAPAAAQYPYPYPQQQQYPGYPGYQQPYGGSVVDQVIGQLLGNRYNTTDRGAVSRCANAAMIQAQNQYRGYSGYQQPYGGYPQQIAAPAMRVTAITNVERRNNGLRVSGLLSSGYGGYNQGYGNQAYASGELSFRCNVDYRGYVSNIRIRPTTRYR